jgi:hypothetical protein
MLKLCRIGGVRVHQAQAAGAVSGGPRVAFGKGAPCTLAEVNTVAACPWAPPREAFPHLLPLTCPPRIHSGKPSGKRYFGGVCCV